MHIKNLKIGARLGVAFAAVLSLTLLIAGMGAMRLMQVDHATDEMEVTIAKVRLADRWLAGSRTNRALVEARVRAVDAADMKAIAARMKDNSADITRTSEELDKLVVLAEGKALLAQIAAKRKIYVTARDEAFAMQDGGADAAAVRKLVQDKVEPALADYETSVTALSARQKRMFDEAYGRVVSTVESGQVLIVGAGVMAVLLGGVLAFLLTRSITVPLRRAVEVANAVAGGDLSMRVQVESKDEAGELMASLKAMTENLNRLVAQVRGGADAIATAAVEVAAGNQDLSARTEEQASSLEESAASLEELTGTVKQNADNALQGNHLAAAAAGVATRGGQVMSDVVQTMGEIDASARQIVEIISVIDGIAFQTNILALNAAVEAARAGEQGRGFAVVAGEVRTLAQRSATAAREIKLLIDNSVEKVGAGTRLVGEAGATIGEVVASVRRVTDIMAEITAASREQSIGIEQVNAAVNQMDNVTQQNAALVEEAAAATEAMQEQANSLAAAVSVFKLDRAAGVAAAPKQPVRTALAAPARKPARTVRGVRPAAAGVDGWEAF